MEKEIKARFGDLPPGGRGAPPSPVPHDHETRRDDPRPTGDAVHVDPSTTSWIAADQTPKADYRRSLVENLYHSMLNARFEELASIPTHRSSPPARRPARSSARATCSRAVARPRKATSTGLAVLFREIERVERTASARASSSAREGPCSSAPRRRRRVGQDPSDEIADEMTRHFFEHEQMPGRARRARVQAQAAPDDHARRAQPPREARGAARTAAWSRLWSCRGRKLADPDRGRARRGRPRRPPTVEPLPEDEGGEAPLVASLPTPGKVTATDEQRRPTRFTRLDARRTASGCREATRLPERRGAVHRVPARRRVAGRRRRRGRTPGSRSTIVAPRRASAASTRPARSQDAGRTRRLDASGWLGEPGSRVNGSARPSDLEAALLETCTRRRRAQVHRRRRSNHARRRGSTRICATGRSTRAHVLRRLHEAAHGSDHPR